MDLKPLQPRTCRLIAFGFILALVGMLAGCSQGSKTDDSGSTAPTGQVAVAQSESRALAVDEGASTTVVLQQLNRELRRYIVRNRRVPASFEEFVANANLTVPPPPAGQRYVIGSDKKIVLE